MILNKTKRLFSFLTFAILVLTVHAQNSKLKLDFSHDHGFYTEPFNLVINPDTAGATIRYTLDGSNPLDSDNFIEVNAPATILINPAVEANRFKAPGVVVRAVAIINDTAISEVKTSTYIFLNLMQQLSPDNKNPGAGWMNSDVNGQTINYGLDPDVLNNSAWAGKLTEALTQIPTIALNTDLRNLFDPDSGIYVNAFYHGREWERPASIELLNPDSSEGFQENCGIRIRGGWSRHPGNPKHAFRIFFRSEYGNGKLDFPLFGDEGADTFDKFDLRTSMNYSWAFNGDDRNTFIREVFSRDTQRDMGQPYTRSRYYHLLINGVYWGLYQTQERSEANYAATYFGGIAEDYDVIKVDVGEDFNLYNVEATDGTLDAWYRLWENCNKDLTDNELYFKIQGLNPDGTRNPSYEKLLDVDNLIDYMIITFYVGDFDGPISAFRQNQSPNNFYAIYNRNNPDGFKFFRHDAEHSLFLDERGIDRTGPFPAGEKFGDSNPQWIHQQLTKNALYRMRFADRVYMHFYNDGALTVENIKQRLDSRKEQIDMAIIAESARWGDSKSTTPFTKTDWLNAVNWIYTYFIPGRQAVLFNQLIAKGLYNTMAAPAFSIKGGIVEPGTKIELSVPAESKIYFTTTGKDPMAVSEGLYSEVVSAGSAKRVLVPKTAVANSWFSQIDYPDTTWQLCSGLPGGIGYERVSGYENRITMNVEPDMYEGGGNANTSCLIRASFNLSEEQISKTTKMTLQIQYDDGFAAYINGVKFAEANAPSQIVWNSAATDNHEANGYEYFDASAVISQLVPGKNVLAIQGLNVSVTSSDFLILPKLIIEGGRTIGDPSEDAVEYSTPITIEQTTLIKARAYSSGGWSPLAEQFYIVKEELSSLKITELHYHPLDEDTISGKKYEFVELKNIGDKELNLGGSKFTDGIDFTFPPDSKIPAGGFVVIASDSEHFYQRYGFMPDGQFSGQLKNSGEQITFESLTGDTVFSFKYSDSAPWPTAADGEGYSLVSRSINPQGNPGVYSYWTVSGELNGSPGKDDIISNVNKENANPGHFYLEQNYPNPYNPTTTINYSIPMLETHPDQSGASTTNVNLTVYDILGREVATLVNQKQAPGNYSVQFDASKLSSGVYFYRLQSGGFVVTKKMILMK